MEADTHETTEDRMYKQSKTDTEVSALLYTRMCAYSLLPLRAEHAEVGFVTPLCVLLSGGEELVGLFRELLFADTILIHELKHSLAKGTRMCSALPKN